MPDGTGNAFVWNLPSGAKGAQAWSAAEAVPSSPAHDLGPMAPPGRFENGAGGSWAGDSERCCFTAHLPDWRLLLLASNDSEAIGCAGARAARVRPIRVAAAGGGGSDAERVQGPCC